MNKQKLMEFLEHPENLPECCFTTLPSDPTMVITIVRGESGYYPRRNYSSAELAKKKCDLANEVLGVSKEAREALTILSIKNNYKEIKTMEITETTLTDIEKEKLLACIGLVATNFEAKRYEIEKELNKIEKEGGRDDRLLDLLEHYRDGQNFYEELEQKVKLAIENNQL